MVAMETTTVMKMLIPIFGEYFQGCKVWLWSDKGRKCYQDMKFSIFLFLTTLILYCLYFYSFGNAQIHFSGLCSLIQFRHLQLQAKKKRKMKKLFHQYAKFFPQMIRTIYQFPYFSMMSVFTQAVLGISREGTASKIRYLMQVSYWPVSVTIPPPPPPPTDVLGATRFFVRKLHHREKFFWKNPHCVDKFWRKVFSFFFSICCHIS